MQSKEFIMTERENTTEIDVSQTEFPPGRYLAALAQQRAEVYERHVVTNIPPQLLASITPDMCDALADAFAAKSFCDRILPTLQFPRQIPAAKTTTQTEQ